MILPSTHAWQSRTHLWHLGLQTITDCQVPFVFSHFFFRQDFSEKYLRGSNMKAGTGGLASFYLAGFFAFWGAWVTPCFCPSVKSWISSCPAFRLQSSAFPVLPTYSSTVTFLNRALTNTLFSDSLRPARARPAPWGWHPRFSLHIPVRDESVMFPL